MKAVTKIYFHNEQNEKFFGEGPYSLLAEIERTGSLRGACKSTGMAYSKALRLMKQAEETLGFPLTERTAGGKSGGGSVLTSEGKIWMQRYAAYRDAVQAETAALFREHFPEYAKGAVHENAGEAESGGQQFLFPGTGLVIMASGMGRRFGSNKLLADFDGQPMIRRILEASDRLFEKRVVVTRHKEVEAICKNLNIPVILHDFSGRNDTIRLGLEYMEGAVETCIFTAADQPLLTKQSLIRLGQAVQEDRESFYRLSWKEQRGMPAAFPAWSFQALMELPDGNGGHYLMKEYPEHVKKVEADGPFELKDADTKEELEELLHIWKTSYSAKAADAPQN